MFIDVAKGIGIIMTIIGHNVFEGYVKTFIYSFHMPLFFVLAGLVMEKKEGSVKTLICEEGKLIRAYFFWSFIYIIFDIVVRIIVLKSPIRLFFLDCYQTFVFWGINVLWFVATLAIAKIIAYKLWMILYSRKQIILALILFFLVYMTTPLVNEIPKMAIYWCIASLLRVFSAVIFIVIGMNSKKILLKILNLKNIYSLIIGILCFCGVSLMGNYMGYIDMRVLMYGDNAILFLLAALTGTVGTILISRLLCLFEKVKKCMSYIGKHSLFLMVTHNYFCFDLVMEKIISTLQLEDELQIVCFKLIILFIVELLMVKIFVEKRNRIALLGCYRISGK